MQAHSSGHVASSWPHPLAHGFPSFHVEFSGHDLLMLMSQPMGLVLAGINVSTIGSLSTIAPMFRSSPNGELDTSRIAPTSTRKRLAFTIFKDQRVNVISSNEKRSFYTDHDRSSSPWLVLIRCRYLTCYYLFWKCVFEFKLQGCLKNNKFELAFQLNSPWNNFKIKCQASAFQTLNFSLIKGSLCFISTYTHL